MGYKYATLSLPGTREINEDSIAVKESNGKLVLVVADGLGGHDKGEVASKIVAETIVEKGTLCEDNEEGLAETLREAQQCLLEKQKQENAVNAMKTTAVALSLTNDRAYLAYVGDSRGYAFLKNGKYIRTIDHSVPQMLALAGDIREKDIRYHEDRSSLLRVFGSEWENDPIDFLEEIDVAKTKAFLLCSDGFWELITESQMKWCLRWSKTPDEWLEKMRRIVEKNGKGKEMDNYTAGAVFIEED
ncbi:MAG: serine/threonine-protein phosphatase [Lachnospiraceae bacterium]|nr:serine/threonine-protein phosphatase [Lachnospiraceae bacterium]